MVADPVPRYVLDTLLFLSVNAIGVLILFYLKRIDGKQDSMDDRLDGMETASIEWRMDHERRIMTLERRGWPGQTISGWDAPQSQRHRRHGEHSKDNYDTGEDGEGEDSNRHP